MAEQHDTVIYRQGHGLGLIFHLPCPLEKLNISVITKLGFSRLTGTGVTDFKGNLPVCTDEISRFKVF